MTSASAMTIKNIPLTTDDQPTALKKLRRLKTEIESAGAILAETYSEDQGYKPNPIAAKSGKWTIEVEK